MTVLATWKTHPVIAKILIQSIQVAICLFFHSCKHWLVSITQHNSYSCGKSLHLFVIVISGLAICLPAHATQANIWLLDICLPAYATEGIWALSICIPAHGTEVIHHCHNLPLTVVSESGLPPRTQDRLDQPMDTSSPFSHFSLENQAPLTQSQPQQVQCDQLLNNSSCKMPTLLYQLLTTDDARGAVRGTPTTTAMSSLPNLSVDDGNCYSDL